MQSVLTGGSWSSTALSPETASTAYDTYASSYDVLDGGAVLSILGLEKARSQLFQQAQGIVLEIGAGTGLNLSFYDPALVTSLTLVDISKVMLQEAKLQATALRLPFLVDFVKAGATSQLVSLFGKNTFDAVVDIITGLLLT
jgi:ubiquinone/menaquinone biosynthesis C-methylase UbiE